MSMLREPLAILFLPVRSAGLLVQVLIMDKKSGYRVTVTAFFAAERTCPEYQNVVFCYSGPPKIPDANLLFAFPPCSVGGTFGSSPHYG